MPLNKGSTVFWRVKGEGCEKRERKGREEWEGNGYFPDVGEVGQCDEAREATVTGITGKPNGKLKNVQGGPPNRTARGRK